MGFGPLAALAAGAALISAEPADQVSKVVEVNGAKYRVTVKGAAVEVKKKKFFVRYDMAERDAQREAVAKATGCRAVDEMPGATSLRAKLDCSAATR